MSDMGQPLVSVMICMYNSAAFIKATIDSVFAQTYTNWELILVDDASTDNTIEVIAEYLKDERVHLIRLYENLHICNAGNVAFGNAVGKFGALLGHDDVWEPHKLEKQVEFMEANSEYGACYTWVQIIDEDGNNADSEHEGFIERFRTDNYTQSEFFAMFLRTGNKFCASSSLFQLDLVKELGGYRYSLVQLQDMDLWLRLLVHRPVYVIAEVLTYYRRFNNVMQNISGNTDENQQCISNEAHHMFDSIIRELSDEKFVELLGNQMLDKNARQHASIVCEKAFLEKKMGLGMANFRLMELMENDEYRKVAHDIYGFKLTDVYKINSMNVFATPENISKIKKQDELIKEQNSLIDEYNKTVELLLHRLEEYEKK